MDRRRFLKLAGLASAGAWFQISVFGASPLTAAAASLGGKLYRGDRRGRIYASRDRGASWQLHTYLGPTYSVKRMAKDRRGGVAATVGYRGREFRLALATDERSWRTT